MPMVQEVSMSDVFHTEITINSLQFDSMMQKDDMKKYFKEKLAFQLAHKLIETNRTTFTYSRDHIGDQYILKGEVRL